jgi:hypothetical protein
VVGLGLLFLITPSEVLGRPTVFGATTRVTGKLGQRLRTRLSRFRLFRTRTRRRERSIRPASRSQYYRELRRGDYSSAASTLLALEKRLADPAAPPLRRMINKLRVNAYRNAFIRKTRFRKKQAFSGQQAKEALRGLTTLMSDDHGRRVRKGRRVRRNMRGILQMISSGRNHRFKSDAALLRQTHKLLGE